MPGESDFGVTFVWAWRAVERFSRVACPVGRNRARADRALFSDLGKKASTGHRRIQVDETVAHHIEGQLGVIAQLHLFEQPGAVHADRLHRQR
ncbi:transposase [Paraburkholderia sp. GAS32]